MSIGTPSAFLLWAILAVTFQVFLIIHLWCYDRFQCVRWNSGRQPGAFKRVMTYSYLATLPMLTVFGIAMTVLKYQEGFVVIEGEVVPKPYELWEPHKRDWILALYVVFSVAWSFEIVTHLEELTFWLFLLHQGPSKNSWFKSWEFRVWYLGSIVAILGMPLTVLVRRENLDTCIAWILLGGSSAGLFTTICFLYVLARFPGFIRHVKTEGAEPDVVVRLAMFYQLNIARVAFRFLFNLSPLILALDALHSPVLIATNPFASDFLLMLTGIGCFVSSAMTLFIFFPRSVTREFGFSARDPSPQLSTKSAGVSASPLPDYYRDPRSPYSPKSTGFYDDPASPDGIVHRAPPFRFPGDDEESDLSSLHRPESIHGEDGEASPRYQSDPEDQPSVSMSVHGSLPSTAPGSKPISDPGHEPLKRLRSSRGTKRPLVDSSPAMKIHKPKVPWQESKALSKAHDRNRRSRDGHRSSIVKGTLFDDLGLDLGGRRFSYSHGREMNPAPPPPTPDIHPYVMNFTSPIDLLDSMDAPGVPRAI